MDRDKLNSTTLFDLAKCSFSIIDKIQQDPPHIQVQALTSLFLLICKVYKVDVRRMLEQTERIMKDAETQEWRPEFRAIEQYIEKEIKDVGR